MLEIHHEQLFKAAKQMAHMGMYAVISALSARCLMLGFAHLQQSHAAKAMYLSVMLQESRLRSRSVVRCCRLCTAESVMLV